MQSARGLVRALGHPIPVYSSRKFDSANSLLIPVWGAVGHRGSALHPGPHSRLRPCLEPHPPWWPLAGTVMNPGDPGNPGRGPMWPLHIPMTGPLAGIRLSCAGPQGGISPGPLRTNRRDQLCVPTPISRMELLWRATTLVSSRNRFPSRNPKSYGLEA